MKPRALAASSGLTPKSGSQALGASLYEPTDPELGGQGGMSPGLLPHWGREGVTLTNCGERYTNDFIRAKITIESD